jgi:hypothetical protein
MMQISDLHEVATFSLRELNRGPFDNYQVDNRTVLIMAMKIISAKN